MSKASNVEVIAGGLICDNENCDYTKPDIPMQDYAAWVGALCPDCGEPLLTEEQYQAFTQVMGIINDVQDLIQSVGEDKLLDILDIDPDEAKRQASLKLRVTKDAGLEVGEVLFKDH